MNRILFEIPTGNSLPGNSNTTTPVTPNSTLTMKIITSIKSDLAIEPITSGSVICRQYWPETTNTGEGGLFTWDANSTLPVDNGIVFAGAGNPATGRWIRYKAGAVATIKDFGAIGTDTPYNPDVSFTASGAPQILLSSKFTTLAAAQAWYSTSSIAALTESLNSAVIQHAHIKRSEILISEGAYWLNRTIEYTRERTIRGVGETNSTLLFDASAGAGFKPKANNNDIVGNNANMKKLILKDFGFYSNAMPYDPSTGAVTTNTVAFDETKSGFYLPKRAAADEASLGNPLLELCIFENLRSQRFAGHAFFIGNIFSSSLSGLRADQCKGWGYRYYGSVGCVFKDSYVGRYNQLGGYWLEKPALCINLNGVDTFETYLPWGQLGNPQDASIIPVGTLINCNFEGCRDSLVIYGDGARIDFQGCQWQWFIAPTAGGQQDTDKAKPNIWCRGGNGQIKFDDMCYFSPGIGSAQITPTNFLWVNGTGWDIDLQGKCEVTGAPLKWYAVDATGADSLIGYGYQNGFRMQSPINRFLSSAGSLYAKYFKAFGRVSVEMLAIGYNQDTGTGESSGRATKFTMIVSGDGAPNGATNQLMRMPKGSMYLRTDGNGGNEIIYVCTGFDSNTGVSTWVAK